MHSCLCYKMYEIIVISEDFFMQKIYVVSTKSIQYNNPLMNSKELFLNDTPAGFLGGLCAQQLLVGVSMALAVAN